MTHVIRRKIDRARLSASEGAPGADRAWRLALARATRDMMGLALEFRRLQVRRLSLAEVLELVPERALVAVLDGPQGMLGALFLSPSVTSAIIEMQTLGRLSSQPAPPRRPTRIDAAMVAGLIDRALSGLDDALVQEADRSWATGYRYASFVDDLRTLNLVLEDDASRVLLADLALGDAGQRAGKAVLALPADGRGGLSLPEAPETQSEMASFAAELSARVLQADCRLDAIIGRLTLPLARIMALEAGQLLALGPAALDSVTVESLDGRRIARARLGQNRGMRAVKLIETGPEVEGRVAIPLLPDALLSHPDEEGGAALRAAG